MVFVLDRRKRPLMPCTEKRARQLLERGRAVVHRMSPFTIRLKDRTAEESKLQPLRLKLDPGSKVTGFAVLREGGPGKAEAVLLGKSATSPASRTRWTPAATGAAAGGAGRPGTASPGSPTGTRRSARPAAGTPGRGAGTAGRARARGTSLTTAIGRGGCRCPWGPG